ncbi:hypothetical protein [Parabacteroides sp. An277]|uniref:hypothetical protein n=1 Tax=Parabacteroides sp. An277 TaxID=1965619 RepID=UPI001121EB37|nr:hypothetical protein [Parabacteroides sp. An277]
MKETIRQEGRKIFLQTRQRRWEARKIFCKPASGAGKAEIFVAKVHFLLSFLESPEKTRRFVLFPNHFSWSIF